MSAVPTRMRTIQWDDPAATAEAGLALSGLEYFTAIARGDLAPPPIMALMRLRGVEFSEGRAVFAVEPGEDHYNPIGVVHGGLALTILDSAMGCAVHTTLPAGTGYTSLEVKVNFVRAVRAGDGRLLAEAKVLHRGGRVATAEARLTREADGKLVAHGSTTCMILAPPG